MVNIIITRYELRKHMNEGHESTKQASASTGTAGQLQGKRVQQNLENKCIPTISKKGKGKNIGDGALEGQCNMIRPKRGRKRKKQKSRRSAAEPGVGESCGIQRQAGIDRACDPREIAEANDEQRWLDLARIARVSTPLGRLIKLRQFD